MSELNLDHPVTIDGHDYAVEDLPNQSHTLVRRSYHRLDTGSTNVVYQTVSGDWGCTCKAHYYGKHCKHLRDSQNRGTTMSTATTSPTSELNKPQQRLSPLVVMASRYQIEPLKLLDILKATVVKGPNGRPPTNEELAAFVIVANEYGLNPLTREIHAFVGQGGSIVPIVGIDGWAKIVSRNPDFDGCAFGEEESDDGTPTNTTCVMWVKGRSHPVEVTEYFAECRRPSQPWQTMPRRMLRHKAFIQCARLCFGLTGIYDPEEGQDIVRGRQEFIAEAHEPGSHHLGGSAGNGGSKGQLPAPAGREPGDEPEQKQEVLEPAPDDLSEVIGKQIEAANFYVLQSIAADLQRHRRKLGEEHYGRLLAQYQARKDQLQAPRKR